MACKRFEKGTAEFQMFSDYWKVVQQYFIPEDNDEYWDSAIAAGEAFCRRYRDSDFLLARKLWLAYMDYLEEKHKNMSQKSAQTP